MMSGSGREGVRHVCIFDTEYFAAEVHRDPSGHKLHSHLVESLFGCVGDDWSVMYLEELVVVCSKEDLAGGVHPFVAAVVVVGGGAVSGDIGGVAAKNA